MVQDDSARQVVFAVDDEKRNLDLIRRTLANVCRLETFDDSEKALTAARASPPDLFLLDYRMPGRDGVRLVADLRAAGVESPVLFLTAYPHDPIVDKTVDYDKVFWVTAKPFDPETLRAEVSTALSLARVRARSKARL